jgi:hypothetical protein
MRKTMMSAMLGVVVLAAMEMGGGAAFAAAGPAAGGSTAAVRAMIGALALGEPARFENLTIVPVSLSSRTVAAAAAAAANAATLDEALKKGWLKIRELDDGDVPRLVVDNRADRPVFIMGGEVVTGGKQDRLIGTDVLVRPRARGVVIPVYCVEAGRWTGVSKQFGTRENLGTWKLRSNAQAAAPAAQESIWGEVEKMSNRAGAASSTSAYQDIYDDRKVNARLAALEKNLAKVPRPAAGTCGVLCAVGGRVVSLDVFSDPALFDRLWPKILRASALAAVTEEAEGAATRAAALAFLGQLSEARLAESRGVDLGTEVRSDGGGITASALVHEGSVLHLSAFPAEESGNWLQAPGLIEDSLQQRRE